MSDTDKVFSGSIPEIYDNFLVPLIFESYAADMARRVADHKLRDVLETAAGTGVVTRALAPLLDDEARYTVTDLNPSMLDRAASRQGADRRLNWRMADALDLPFADRSFDAVCCQFGAMFFPARVRGYAEALRVLKPGGRFVFSVWDKIEENEFAHVVTEVAGTVFPDDLPLFLARTPHGYHDTGVIREELAAAGFGDVEISTISAESGAPSPRHPAIAYCQGTPLRNEIEARDAALLEHVTDRAAEAIAARFGAEAVSGRIRAHVIVATT
jgi:ubiquinone/menaquinone biosynthesis C-methylase UbiE